MKVDKSKFSEDEINRITEIMKTKEERERENKQEMSPLEHPSYHVFQNSYKDFCNADDRRIEAIWKELIEGYRIQIKNADLAMQKSTNKEYLETINNNVHFINAVKMIQEDGGLAVPESMELALWSGGYDLSVKLRSMRLCPLEGTPFGNMLDTLKVTWEWKREGGLWNILSAAFVNGYEQGKQAHIYFRIVDEMSVLYEQELPMLMSNPERVIVFHPIYQQGTEVSEVGYIFDTETPTAIVLSPENRVFAYMAKDLVNEMKGPGGFRPYTALEQVLKRSGYETNQKAYDNYRSDKFIPGHAPFAREDEPTAGRESQREARNKFWNK